MITVRKWDPLWVFLVIVGIGLGLVGLARDNQRHIVSYTVQQDEVAVSRTMFFRRKIHRQEEVVVFNDRYASLNVYKTRGSVKLTNDPAKTGLIGQCAWDISFRFSDGVRAALCGAVEYELSRADNNILAIDKYGGERWTEHLVKIALLEAARVCAASTTAMQVFYDSEQKFLRCVEYMTRSTVALAGFEGLALKSSHVFKLEYQDMAPNPLDRSRRGGSGGYV